MDRDNASSTATQAKSGMTRRGVMRKTAVGLGAAATVGAGVSHPRGIVQESEAVAPLLAAGVIGTSAAVGWALREFEVVGSDPPAEGLTPDVLKQQVYETGRTRQSTNASTIVDNGNILDGVEHSAYTDAKIAAIEELNAGSAESDALAAGEDAIASYQTTIQKNLLKTWNESVREFRSLADRVVAHADVNLEDVLSSSGGHSSDIDDATVTSPTTSLTLADGTSFTVEDVELDIDSNLVYSATWNPTSFDESHPNYNYSNSEITWSNGSGDSVMYLEHNAWNSIWSEIQTKFTNVSNGMSTWVTNVYGDVQSGEIEISELVTPRERAAMMSEEEGMAQAIADLAALNISVDSERKATVSLQSPSVTLSGTIGLTDSSDGPIESGTTYDPSTFAGDIYLTADMSEISGTWSDYQTAVDGGTMTITAEPYEGTVLNVTTTAGETVSVSASDWTDNGDGTWSYDASADLETNITEVDSVALAAASSETNIETLNISKEFTVDALTNEETGEEAASATFESSEPQTDSNYITKEEWDSLEQQNKELIEKYEESQTTAGGGGGFLGGSLFEDTRTLGIVAGGAALAALLFGNR